MLELLRRLIRLVEWTITLPIRALFLVLGVILSPRLGYFRFALAPVVLFLLAAFLLVYVYAPIRGYAGLPTMGEVLKYANERSLGTAIRDANDRYVGIFDPRLDSQRDFLPGQVPVEIPGYFVAYPDHKSLHVTEVPEHFWACLKYHEDRYLGKWWGNPFGIDLFGVLKIPVSAVKRTLASGRPQIGVGGSTLSMQLARVFFKKPPDPSESIGEKLGRKLKEWWVAPVIQRMLIGEGDYAPLKRWAANHLPMGQRTGGQPLYGIEQTALTIFKKPASELTRAEQYILASAVNHPIIVLKGSEKLNALRLRHWRRLVEKRAGQCVRALVSSPAEQLTEMAALTTLAGTPPEPWKDEDTMVALPFGKKQKLLVSANPIRRANALLPSAKYGVRAQMKQTFGYNWRLYVKGVHVTLDAVENLAFREKVLAALSKLQAVNKRRLNPRYSLDVKAVLADRSGKAPKLPDIVLVAADEKGRIVRYFEGTANAAYFGSQSAIDKQTGYYDPSREGRAVASAGKMIAAVAIGNDNTDTAKTVYVDPRAPRRGLETCRRGNRRLGRKPEVVFACSLNEPLEWRLNRIGEGNLIRLVQNFGLNLPVTAEGRYYPAAAIARGHLMGSPRQVHHMAAVILAALTGRAHQAVPLPSLVDKFDRSSVANSNETGEEPSIVPARLPIRPEGYETIKRLLSAPLCHHESRRKRRRHGTLKFIHQWCAENNPKVALHIAKTGTRGTGDPDPSNFDTVDLWTAGGIQFANGRSYSYVALIGTGRTTPGELLGRDIYSGRTLSPLLNILLTDLEALSRKPKQGLPVTSKMTPDSAQMAASNNP